MRCLTAVACCLLLSVAFCCFLLLSVFCFLLLLTCALLWTASHSKAVKAVTHIAPADADGCIIGEEVVQEGVIAVPAPNSLGLCSGVTNADYATTTEVYPDSPSSSDEQCNRAQVACVVASLNYLIDAEGL